MHILALLLILTLLGPGASMASAADFPRSPHKWSTVQKDGIHWLVSPEGQLFYSKGVNFIDAGKESRSSQQKQAFFWRNFFPSIDDWRRAVTGQLMRWGFNTRGGWCDASPWLDLPLTVDLELGRNSKFHWFDPFDPDMEQKSIHWAEKLTAPYRNDHHLMGYFSDNEVGWWNSPLFDWFLGKGWENHTKRVLWQLLYDHYGGQWEALLQDWVPDGSLGSFQELRSADVKLRLRPGGQGIRLVDRFMYLCAQRYYKLMYQAIKAVHPNALVLGDRLPLYYHQDAILAMGDSIDVISTNYNIDVPDGWVAPYYFDGLRRLTEKPVLVTEFFFAAEENRSGNRNETARSKHPKPGHLMTVSTQAERARGLANAIRNLARFPNVVGAHWFQYCDEPFGGREDGEDYNMGLIDTANRPYQEVTETFRLFNPQLEAIHLESAKAGPRETSATSEVRSSIPASSRADSEPRAALRRTSKRIDVNDQSLMDWDKEQTRLQDLKTPQPYVPFGDVHLSWGPEGLYLASLSNTYLDPNFLAYQGEFPKSEAFQLHLIVESGGKPLHYAVYLLPQPNPLFPDGFEVKPQLYRHEEGKPIELLPTQGHVQRIEKSLPHMVLEAFFPAEWFGMERFDSGMELRMNVVLTNYYRELTMSWSGAAVLESSTDPHSLRTVVLRDHDEKTRPHVSMHTTR